MNATLRAHPVVATRLPEGFKVLGLADPGRRVDSIYCCEACSPGCPVRSDWERMRVAVQPPSGMTRKQARRILRATMRRQ